MNTQKAITYSLLAHVRNTATLIEGPLDVFVPLLKRSLSLMNDKGIFSGKSIYEINDFSKKLYDINFPLPVLRKILDIIISNVEEDGVGAFIINNDNSFAISNYTFTDFDDIVKKRELEIKKLEELFQDFCTNSKFKIDDNSSIFSFLEKNKLSLAKYLSNAETSNGHDYIAEAQFVDFFKNIPPVYELIKSLYLGSILAEYIEFTPSALTMNIELLLDTNFIISLIDLNAPESTHTCNTLVDIVKEQGYLLSILPETIDEIKYLLQAKADNYNKSFMVQKVYTEDIYNACDRRKLTKVDLERIIDSIEKTILSFGIEKVTNYTNIIEEALQSDSYKFYKTRRQSEISAKHDAIAIHYVQNKRGKKRIKDFTDVKCWFVNNAISRNTNGSAYERKFQPEIIKADDLLSILWLSNPNINSLLPANNIANIGLSSLLSLTFTESLPKTSIIREFEDNIQKYRTDTITDTDIVNLSTRIADKQLTDIEELNALANENSALFIERLEEESNKQQEAESEKMRALSKIVTKFESEIESIEKHKITNENSIAALKDEAIQKQKEIDNLSAELSKQKEIITTGEIEKKVLKWQFNSRILLLIVTVIFFIPTGYIFLYMREILEESYVKLIGIIASAIWFFISKAVYDRHFNESNISSYKARVNT